MDPDSAYYWIRIQLTTGSGFKLPLDSNSTHAKTNQKKEKKEESSSFYELDALS